MNSFLIIGADQEQRLEKAQLVSGLPKNISGHPDLLIIESETAVKISQIRQIKKFLSRRPFQAEFKTVIVPQAEKMTIPAQNAFLKILEEPPANSIIILISSSQNQLLATILSRCQLIKLNYNPKSEFSEELLTEHKKKFKQIVNSGPAGRLKLIEAITVNKTEAENFLAKTIFVLQKELLSEKPNPKLVKTIKQTQKTLNLIKNNINLKLALENYVLRLELSF